MTRGGKRQGNYTAEAAAKRVAWNLSADASVEAIGDWDIKTEQFARAVLAVLSSGCAVMLGTTMSGGAVSVTIYDGDAKQRVYCTDSIELDDLTDRILAQSRPQSDISQKGKLRAVGD